MWIKIMVYSDQDIDNYSKVWEGEVDTDEDAVKKLNAIEKELPKGMYTGIIVLG